MDLGVVVEGIETEQEAKVFLDLNCDEAQGFYYHKPMPADKFRGLLESEQGTGAQP
jgi:EAL domain-containing protein (putative c-di-GMP-specific phosphodiesterase class I)